jgi:FK506-binding nuclear protein
MRVLNVNLPLPKHPAEESEKEPEQPQAAGNKRKAAAPATPTGKKQATGAAAQQQPKKAATPAAAKPQQPAAAAKTPQQQPAAKTPQQQAAPPAGAARLQKPRKFENGFEIHDVKMGQPDGRVAKAGKRVSMRYVGRLAKGGKVFDSNTKGKPFAFRLGVGEVIKGWDRGVEGMRVGDKRKLVIPPQMAYGTQKLPGIPPNSTLEFDVELVEVK